MLEKIPKKEKKEILNFLEEKYGVSQELFKKYELYSGTEDKISLGPKSILKFSINTGLLILRDKKPTTSFFQTFGKYVTKNFIILNKEQTYNYIKGKDLEFESDLQGYVLIRYESFNIGCGFLKNNILKNQLPKTRQTELKFL